MHAADAVLRRWRQHWYVDRVLRHQFGEERAALQPAKTLGFGVGQIEKVLAQRIPEWRMTLLVAIADDFGDHRLGEPLCMRSNEQQARPRQQFRKRRAHQRGVNVETAQQGMPAEVMAQRQRRYAVLDVQFPRSTGEMAVAQAVERLLEAGGGKDFRAADQLPAFEIFQHEEVVLRPLRLSGAIEGRARRGDFFAQVFAVIRQRGHADQALAGQAL